MISRIGFMQGRLCDQINGKIQAFPVTTWRTEFPKAEAIGLHLMEWTIDQDGLQQNPLMTNSGRREIAKLCLKHKLNIESVTGDCFMQAPFWKLSSDRSNDLKRDFLAVCQACADLGISTIVLPLVDNGRIETPNQESKLVAYLLSITAFLKSKNLKIAFEIDYEPKEILRFLDSLPSCTFGINYDIGNSASQGFDLVDEFKAFGSRIFNVHVKDRIVRGTTVPLGSGSADFDKVFSLLSNSKYQGNFILQTARALDGKHIEVLQKYQKMVQNWMAQYGLDDLHHNFG